MKSSRWQYAAFIVLGTCLAPTFLLRAQPPTSVPLGPIEPVPTTAQPIGTFRYLGTAECELCHSRGPTPTQLAEGVQDRACLTELLTWREADKHADAYKSLLGERGQKIAALLNTDVTNPDAGCVSCHSTPDNAGGWSQEGVACEACHGPSSQWSMPHRSFPDWRNTPDETKTTLGWIDVRSPKTRAELCVSCHVGSAAYGRVITHEMYAAGHPPLAGFELESFSDAMPRHWRYASEKPAGEGPQFERTRKLLIAAVVAMRMAVELAAADAASPQPAARWPEFARLDCFACHHELESPGRRPVGQELSRQGRPALVVGCLPLVRVAARLSGGPQAVDELNGLVKRLQMPFASHPFGDSAEVARLGQPVSAWCQSIERRLDSIDITPEKARAILRQIAAHAADRDRDYDTARQLLGAWVVAYGELQAAEALPLTDAHQRHVEEVLAIIASEYPQLARREPLAVTCGTAPARKSDYNQSLSQHYKNRIEYDPARFRELMTRLARSLPE